MSELNHENQLSEIEKLERELVERKAALENSDKEVSKEQPEQKEDERRYQIEKEPAAAGQTAVQPQSQVQSPAKPAKKTAADFKNLDKDHQVKILSVVAFEEGITRAVDMARHLNDAYVLDELHDHLVGELYEKLVKEGKLKKV